MKMVRVSKDILEREKKQKYFMAALTLTRMKVEHYERLYLKYKDKNDILSRTITRYALYKNQKLADKAIKEALKELNTCIEDMKKLSNVVKKAEES